MEATGRVMDGAGGGDFVDVQELKVAAPRVNHRSRANIRVLFDE